MTGFAFSINGKDFSDIVHKYGYQTDLIPVYSKTVTTLDGYDHQRLIRMRGMLAATLNPVPMARAAEFASALRQLPATVRYYSFQQGAIVEQTMRVTRMPFDLTLITPETNWLDGATVTFEQL